MKVVPVRPKTTFGILSTIFGGLGLFFIGNFCLMYLRASAAAEAWSPVYRAISIHGAIISTMSAALLVVGIGQLRRRRWADPWAAYWGGAALACVAVLVAISLLKTGPALRAAGALSAPPGVTMWDAPLFELYLFPHQLSPVARATVLIFFYTPYPLLMLLRFARPDRPPMVV